MRYSLRRRAFSLVELLVVITIILVLMALMGAAVSAARSSGAKQKTAATIMVIDTILSQYYRSMDSSRAGAGGPATDRGVALRRQMTADMPDSWAEVVFMKQRNDATPEDEPKPFNSARQRGYIAAYETIKPSPQHSSAECLFMIVTQGGLADCLTCSPLSKAKIGDKDEDGALEFWDEWDQPIRYILWPAGFELPIGTRFFSADAPFDTQFVGSASNGTMRPLIFSEGPSGGDPSRLSSTVVNKDSYLSLGDECGKPPPSDAPPPWIGGSEGDDTRSDNITNFDGEVKR